MIETVSAWSDKARVATKPATLAPMTIAFMGNPQGDVGKLGRMSA
jgi:hypothetical protein